MHADLVMFLYACHDLKQRALAAAVGTNHCQLVTSTAGNVKTYTIAYTSQSAISRVSELQHTAITNYYQFSRALMFACTECLSIGKLLCSIWRVIGYQAVIPHGPGPKSYGHAVSAKPAHPAQGSACRRLHVLWLTRFLLTHTTEKVRPLNSSFSPS